LVLMLLLSFFTPSVPAPQCHNMTPIAHAGGPYSGFVNQSILFDGSESRDGDGYITGYRWDWTNDGVWDTEWLAGPTVSYAYAVAGSYTVKLETIDDGEPEYPEYCAESDTDIATVTVITPQPKADFFYTPTQPSDLDTVQFRDKSSVSYDTIISWVWSFGDGTTSSEQNPTHRFTDDGSYKVSLTVEAGLGGTGTVTKYVTIENIAPVATITEITPNPTSDCKTVLFNGSGEDLDGDVVGYWWNSSIDGNLSNLSLFNLSGLSLGVHVISFKVVDDDGTWSNVTTKKLTVTENKRPENIKIQGPSNGKKGREYTYTIVGYDPDNDGISYFVDWGDGSNSSWVGPYPSNVSCELSHIWNNKSSFTITACGQDEYGSVSDWTNFTVTMPYSYDPMLHFLELLLQRFPNAFPILRHLLGY
jgi:PKD repeat protein